MKIRHLIAGLLLIPVVAFAAVTVSVNGTSYSIPQTNEKGWGANVTSWIQGISSNTLQPTGGSFTLTADVDFGGTYGLKSTYYKSRTSNISSVGQFRLANADTICFRNSGNSANLCLGPSATGNGFLAYDSVDLVGTSLTQTLTNKTISGASNTITNVSLTSGVTGTLPAANGGTGVSSTATFPSSGVIVTEDGTSTLTNKTFNADGTGNSITNIENADIKSGAAIALNKLAATTASRALVSDGSGVITPATTTSTEIGYVNGVTSAIQTQINAKAPTASPTFTGTVTTPLSTAGPVLTSSGGVISSEAQLAVSRGGTGQSTAAAAFNALHPMTTTGDMIYSSSGTTSARLAVGSSGQVLKSVGGVPTWATFSGGINYLSANPDAESDTTGWTTYADAAQNIPVDATGGSPSSTWTRTASSPLRGAGSFLWTRTAANRQGEGVAYAFTLDNADLAKPIQISFDYKVASGTFFAADGITAPLNDGTTSQNAGMSDLEVFIYDVTNSSLIPVTGQTLAASSTLPTTYKGTFQSSSTGTSYRLILHTARSTAVAFTMQFDNFYLGPQITASGPAMSDWVAYTPSITNGTKGSGVTEASYWRRVGDSIEIHYKYAQTGAGTSGSGNYVFGLPSGLSIDTSKLATGGGMSLGTAYGYNGTSEYSGYVTAADSTGFNLNLFTSATAVSTVSSSFVPLGNATARYSFTAFVPVTGWSSNAVMSNDTDTRVVSAKYKATSNRSPSAGTAVNYDTKIFDTHGGMSSGTYTVPVSGYYKIDVTAQMTGATAANVIVYKNGSSDTSITTANTTNTTSGTTTVLCNAGDTLFVGSDGAPTFAANANWITITRLSGPATIAATETVAATYDTSTTSIGTGTSPRTICKFTNKIFDTHGAYNTSTGLYTIPVSGRYRISGHLVTSAVTNSTTQELAAWVQKNASDVAELGRTYGNGASISIGTSGSYTGSFVAGDTVGVSGYNGSGSVGLVGGVYNTISIERIGN